jgi:hypothetical protein
MERGILARQLWSGYGSWMLSPPDWVFHSPFPQLGHGGKLRVEPTSIVSPQLVHW